MTSFDEFFDAATTTDSRPDRYEPHGYQKRIAQDGLPSVVRAPTRTGKTGIILAWLWRRTHESFRDETPRRLVYALPDLEHRKGEAGRTDLTLDPFLSVRRDDELLVRWDCDLPGEQRQVLAKLAELLPYLGRSESVCEARLADCDAEPDETWWRPGAHGSPRVRLLAVTRPVSMAALEASTSDIRRRRRTVPPGTRWVSYALGKPLAASAPADVARAPEAPVTAIRFAVTGRVPVKATHGILLADEAHRLAGHELTRAGLADLRRQQILGSNGAATDHHHAHWVPLVIPGQEPQLVRHLIVWVPRGLRTEDVAALLSLREMSGRRGSREDAYDVRGLPPVQLLFQAAGPVGQVTPELCGPARRWRSLTPYLPVRHRKREYLEDFLTADVRTELGYQGLPPATVIPADPEPQLPDRWALAAARVRRAGGRAAATRAAQPLRIRRLRARGVRKARVIDAWPWQADPERGLVPIAKAVGLTRRKWPGWRILGPWG